MLIKKLLLVVHYTHYWMRPRNTIMVFGASLLISGDHLIELEIQIPLLLSTTLINLLLIMAKQQFISLEHPEDFTINTRIIHLCKNRQCKTPGQYYYSDVFLWCFFLSFLRFLLTSRSSSSQSITTGAKTNKNTMAFRRDSATKRKLLAFMIFPSCASALFER